MSTDMMDYLFRKSGGKCPMIIQMRNRDLRLINLVLFKPFIASHYCSFLAFCYMHLPEISRTIVRI